MHLPENKNEYFPGTTAQSVHAKTVPVYLEQHPEQVPYIPKD